MFHNTRIEQYYRQCEELLTFTELSWWIIDLEYNPDVYYCNQTMCETFYLDSKFAAHSVSKTCPIAGDYNKNIALRNSSKALRVFEEYRNLKDGSLDEYHNRFPYYDEVEDKVRYFTSRAKALAWDSKGQATLLLGIIEPERASERLHRHASLDSLTGVKNRREFDSQLTLLINLARRERRTVSLILFDIDHFKLYNDNLGHYAGDMCLKSVASSLARSCSCETDTVYRYGGEEFAYVLYGENQNISALAERARNDISELSIPHPESNLGIVTISGGYASLVPSKSTTPKTLIEKADSALYVAKSEGRNRTCGSEQSHPSMC